jgi:tRNA(fMet)-specific endonuclease VapC
MKYLLDTDHLSIFQRQTGDAYQNLCLRMSECSPSDLGISIVTVHEQFLGTHAFLNQAKRLKDLIVGYEILSRSLKDALFFTVVEFDVAASECFDRLSRQKVRLGVMDARIASIALSQDLVLLTRNTKDFVKIPDLKFEDWTIAQS